MKKMIAALMVCSLLPALASAQTPRKMSKLTPKEISTVEHKKLEGKLNSVEYYSKKAAIEQEQKEMFQRALILGSILTGYPNQARNLLTALADLHQSIDNLKNSDYGSYQTVFFALEDLGEALQSIPNATLRELVKSQLDYKYYVQAYNKSYSLATLAHNVINFIEANSEGANVEMSVGNEYFNSFQGKGKITKSSIALPALKEAYPEAGQQIDGVINAQNRLIANLSNRETSAPFESALVGLEDLQSALNAVSNQDVAEQINKIINHAYYFNVDDTEHSLAEIAEMVADHYAHADSTKLQEDAYEIMYFYRHFTRK